MALQHQVIIALGSNLGDRKQIIEKAILSIHQNVGTVVAVSRLYESPSWGFESDAFYNAAIKVNTLFSAENVLENLLEIELQLGRNRSENSGYSARNIDLDVIAFDAEIIESDFLKVPHPFMDQRMFVLKPLLDIDTDWKHPVLEKSVQELVHQTSDTNPCVAIDSLKLPLANFQLRDLSHIAIEGNIGAGKTTLTLRIAEDFNARTVLERFADNPFLPKFYEDGPRYAFPLEMSFLADRYQQITDDLSQLDLFSDFIIADYHIYKSLIFARITLGDDEFRLYRKLFDIMYREVAKPDLYVFLYQETPRLLQNIQKRGRQYEQEIESSYLDNINKGYLDFIRSMPETSVLLIDITDKDFVNNQEDYLFILNAIDAKIRSINASK